MIDPINGLSPIDFKRVADYVQLWSAGLRMPCDTVMIYLTTLKEQPSKAVFARVNGSITRANKRQSGKATPKRNKNDSLQCLSFDILRVLFVKWTYPQTSMPRVSTPPPDTHRQSVFINNSVFMRQFFVLKLEK